MTPRLQEELSRFRIADLEIDVGRQRVTRGGEEIPLPKLSFDLLLALARAAPNLVSFDGLMQAVWPGLAVTPETVSQRVKLLRDALGDDARDPRYVAGLRGRGYRLVPPVRGEPPLAADEAITEAAPGSPPNGSGASWFAARASWRFGFAALLAIAAVSLAIRFSSREGFVHPADARSVPPSVAILPFASLSEAREDRHLALGFAQVVQHRIGASRNLRVIASASLPSQTEGGPREVGEALGARFLVDGSIQRDGNRLRVTTRLVDARDGVQIWSLRFDRDLQDIFAIQDEIADRVVAHVVSTVRGEPHGMRPQKTVRFDAYLAFLEGRALLAHYRVAETQESITKLEEAIALEPRFPEALVALAEARVRRAWLSGADGREAWESSRPLVARALEVDASFGEALVMRGWWDMNEAELRRGLDLAPNYAPGYALLGELMWELGREAEAEAAILTAVQIDPFNARNHHLRGLWLGSAGHLDEGRESFERALAADPSFHPSLTRLATLERMGRGRFALAATLIERALSIDPASPMVRDEALAVYLDLGEVDAARTIVSGSPPEQRANQAARLALYEGEVERAAAALSGGDASDIVLRFAVIRDLALHRDSEERAVAQLEAILPERAVREAHFSWKHIPFVDLPRAHLLLRASDAARASGLAAEVLRRIDERPEQEIDAWYRPDRAVALAIQGDPQGALAELAKDAARGARGGRWYTLERDPSLASIRELPRFREIRAAAHTHAERERAAYRAERSRRDAPKHLTRAPENL